MVGLSGLNYTTGRPLIEATGGARTPRRLYAPPTPHTERGGLLGLEQGCHHLLATSTNMGIVDIQQLLANLDTMSTLVSDTLVSPRGAPTLRMDRHHTRANIRILEQLIEF